nr:uncharacterized protein LOC116156028 [Camelus dromedarius]
MTQRRKGYWSSREDLEVAREPGGEAGWDDASSELSPLDGLFCTQPCSLSASCFLALLKDIRSKPQAPTYTIAERSSYTRSPAGSRPPAALQTASRATCKQRDCICVQKEKSQFTKCIRSRTPRDASCPLATFPQGGGQRGRCLQASVRFPQAPAPRHRRAWQVQGGSSVSRQLKGVLSWLRAPNNDDQVFTESDQLGKGLSSSPVQALCLLCPRAGPRCPSPPSPASLWTARPSPASQPGLGQPHPSAPRVSAPARIPPALLARPARASLRPLVRPRAPRPSATTGGPASGPPSPPPPPLPRVPDRRGGGGRGRAPARSRSPAGPQPLVPAVAVATAGPPSSVPCPSPFAPRRGGRPWPPLPPPGHSCKPVRRREAVPLPRFQTCHVRDLRLISVAQGLGSQFDFHLRFVPSEGLGGLRATPAFQCAPRLLQFGILFFALGLQQQLSIGGLTHFFLRRPFQVALWLFSNMAF